MNDTVRKALGSELDAWRGAVVRLSEDIEDYENRLAICREKLDDANQAVAAFEEALRGEPVTA